jgi:ADP-heptose:LPS heptosyltransferase
MFNVLIIKFGAMGDVLRTTPILREIGRDNEITWVTDEDSADILRYNNLIHQLIVFDYDTTYSELKRKHFDKILCLDQDERATALALTLHTKGTEIMMFDEVTTTKKRTLTLTNTTYSQDLT